MTRPGTLYQLLGVPPDAAAAEITRAYHRRARAVHPDAHPGHPGSTEEFRALEAAYRVLRDPARRAAYDQTLAPPTPMPPPSPPWPAPPGTAGRLPGATLRPGPVFVDPAGPATDPTEARLAALVLLAWRLAEEEWPW